MVAWLGLYHAATRGVLGADNATVRLDYENVVQPDALLRLDAALGGRSKITPDDYLTGPPELVVEIAASSVSYDLGVKRLVYARSGVQEYLAAQAYEQRVDWFVLREGVFEALQPDADGILRSEVFPGLWLPAETLWAGDLAGMIAVLQQGLASAEHAAFVAQLQERMAAIVPSANP
jgi:Uma2 family endonuclease